MNNLRKGSNQYVYRRGLGLKTEVQRDVWLLVAAGMAIFMAGREWRIAHPTLSPCPLDGCLVSKVEAAGVDAKVELARMKYESEQPTKENVIAYIAKVFAPEGTAVQVRAIRCFYSESGLRTEAYNWNPAYTDKNGKYYEATEDRGVAQVNSVHGMKPEDAHNYKKNIDKAYQIYKGRGKNFSAWYGKDCN